MQIPTEPSQELRALLDAAVDGIIIIDHQGLIQTFNQAAERLFGYPAREVLGRNVSMLMTTRDRDAHDGHLARFMATRHPHVIGTGREVAAQRHDGSVFPALLSVGVVLGFEPPRFVGFVHDITARRQAEDAALRLQDRLLHVSRLVTVGEMSSGIAHELNQPLAAIATYAHACDRLLSQPQPDIEEVQGALREIAQQAVRAGDIIRRLRGLARTEDSPRQLADLNSVVQELSDLIESDARSHGVSYRVELAPDLPQVLVDRAQIQQVVLNLVRNALEALALGQLDVRELTVQTRGSPEGEVEISVCDTGPGVDSSVAERIFDPFCSTKPTGTGLGLPISRTIARTHGGTLDYGPNVPTGTCFRMRLPAAQTDQP